jgi:hypothetical protein
MYTSTLLCALLSVPGAADTPTWSTNYQAAVKEGATAGKPLAVILGTGKNGYEKVVRDGGELSAACRKHLAAHYVCVYADTSTETGKRLADAFAMPGGQGIILSDRTGAVQAFRHEGALSNADLSTYLERYGSDRAVTTTETADSIRGSSYEAAPTGGGAPAGGHAGHGGYVISGGSAGGCIGGSCYSGGCSGGQCSDGHHGRQGRRGGCRGGRCR